MALLTGNHIGSVYIKVRPDTKDFREEVDRDLRKPLVVDAKIKPDVDQSELANTEREIERTIRRMESQFTVRVNHDYDSLNNAVSKIEAKLKDVQAVSIKVATDEASLREALEVFEDLRDEHPVEVTFAADEAGYQSVIDKMRSIQRERITSTVEFDIETDQQIEDVIEEYQRKLEDAKLMAPIEYTFTPDEAGYRSLLARIEQIRRQRLAIDVDLNVSDEELRELETQTFHAIMEYRTRVNPLAAAHTEASLKLLGRDRWVELKPRLNARAMGLLSGSFMSLAGLNTVGDFMETLENIAMNFDTVMLNAGKMAAVIGTAASVGITGFGALLTTIRDISETLQLAALAPAVLLSGFAGMKAWQSIWGGFEAALMGIPGALEQLPPHAQKAVAAIEDLQDATNKAVQDGFWAKMTDEIYRFVEAIGPTVVTVMGQVASEYGRAISEMMTHTDKLIKSGQLGEFADNNTRLFHDLTDAAVPFFEAFMTLGIRGSRYLPVIGDALQNASERFRDFIDEADRTGKIDLWIRNGINAFYDLGSSVSSTLGIFGNLTDVFDSLNIGGLRPMANGLREIERFTATSGFQSKMRTIFSGAKDGAAEAARGFGDLIRVVYNADDVLGDTLRKSGELAGEMMSTFSSFLNQPILQQGVLEGLDGLIDFTRTAQPAFEALGRTFGRLGEIGAEVARQIAPGLTITMQLIDQILERMGPSMIRAVEPLTDVFEDLSFMATGPLVMLAGVAADLLDTFSALPPVLQNTVLTLGMMSKFGLTSVIAGWVGSLQLVNGEFRKVDGSIQRTAELNRRTIRAFGTETQRNATGFGKHWNQMQVGATRAMRGISGAAKTMWAAVGGWPTVALTAVVGIFSTISGEVAESKASVEEIRGTLDQFTGEATQATGETIFKKLSDELGWFEKQMGNLGQDFTFNDVADALGMSMGEITGILAKGGEASDQLMEDLWELREAMLLGADDTELRKVADAIGFTGDVTSLTLPQLTAFTDRLQQVKGETDAGRDGLLDFNNEMGITGAQARTASPRFQALSEAIGRVKDEASDADSRVRALKDAIDLFEGKDRSADELQKQAVTTIERVMEELESAAAEKEFDWSLLFNSDGSFNKDSSEWAFIDDIFDDMETGHLAAIEGIRTQWKQGEIDAAEYKTAMKKQYDEMEAAGVKMADQLGLEGEQRKFFLQQWDSWIPEEKTLSIIYAGDTPEDRAAAIEKLKEAGISLSEAQYEMFFDINKDDVVDELEFIQKAGEMIEREVWVATVSGDTEGVTNAVNAALEMGLMWSGSEYISMLDADGEPTAAAVAYAEVLGYTWADGVWESTLTASGDQLDAAIAAAETSGLIFSEGVFTAELGADGQPANDAIVAAQAMGLVWDTDHFTAELDANGVPAQAAIDFAKASGLNWDGSKWTSELDADGKPNQDAVAAAKILGLDWDDDVHTATLDGDEQKAKDSASNAKRAADGFADGDYDASLTATNSTGGGFDSAMRFLRNNWIGKTFSAILGVTSAITGSANGSMTGTQFKPKVHQFANGGFENHTAQITSPNTPIRIWSEPETHGEAYIPLSSAKRTRSLAIWKEVGKRFGVYANGGVTGGGAVAAGNNYTINVSRSGATGGDVAQAIDYYQRRSRRV